MGRIVRTTVGSILSAIRALCDQSRSEDLWEIGEVVELSTRYKVQRTKEPDPACAIQAM
jgi:hypothetical protein